MKAGPVDVVRAKRIEIPIYSSPSAGRENYIVSYYVDGRRKRDRAGTTLEAARAFARAKIEELANGTAHVGSLTPKQLAVVNDAVDVLKSTGVPLSRAAREYADAFRILGRQPLVIKAAEHYAAHLEQEKRKAELVPITLPELVARFMEHIRERKKSRRYTLDMQARLARAAKAFTGRIVNIQSDDIDDWLKSMKGVSGRTKNNYRSAIHTLFAFARDKGYLPRDAKTEVEFSARYDDKGGEIGVYSPEQLSILLTSIERRFVPFVAIGAFAGLRSAEICRLTWDDIRWHHGDIELKKAKAKTASRRLAPLLPCLGAWLLPFRKNSGPVLDGIRDEFDLARQFKKAVDAIVDAEGKPLVKIVHNGLRHSFITYRLATEKSAAAVALEAGNSPKMIFEHYRELRTEAEGKEWFSIMPAAPGKIVAIS
jgi:integrase